jgi:transposase
MTSSKAFPWPGTGKKARRTFTADFKRDLVEQTLAPGASISGIALANGLNANQLFAWRRKLLPQATATSHAVLLPVHLKEPIRVDDQSAASPIPVQDQRTGHIEITRHQTTVRLHGLVDHDTLRIVLHCLAS